jgi:hypothetical protein
LWCIKRIDGDEVECMVYDTVKWNMVTKICIDDTFGNSYFSFHETPYTNLLALWMAAGQDGQELFWLSVKKQMIECLKLESLSDHTPPCFLSCGNEFLIIDEEDRICKYSYPELELLGKHESQNDDYMAGYSLCSVNERKALAILNERVFLFDIERMCVLEEVIVEGHEPQPTEFYYPSLKGETELCTDISHFEKFGDKIIMVAKKKLDVEAWIDEIMFLIVKDELS